MREEKKTRKKWRKKGKEGKAREVDPKRIGEKVEIKGLRMKIIQRSNKKWQKRKNMSIKVKEEKKWYEKRKKKTKNAKNNNSIKTKNIEGNRNRNRNRNMGEFEKEENEKNSKREENNWRKLMQKWNGKEESIKSDVNGEYLNHLWFCVVF